MPSEIEPRTMSDDAIVDYLRRAEGCTISDLVKFAGVTATAIRQRLNRLMEQGLVIRETESVGRGRPMHRYSLSPAGLRAAGNNYEDLAHVLWSELRSVDDPDVRYRLMQRVVERLAEIYRNKMDGETLHERLSSLVDLMGQRDMPFEIQAADEDNPLPILKILACPYPDLAEQDRTICSLEKMLFSEVLGEKVRLGDCRLDGSTCCTFEMSSASVSPGTMTPATLATH